MGKLVALLGIGLIAATVLTGAQGGLVLQAIGLRSTGGSAAGGGATGGTVQGPIFTVPGQTAGPGFTFLPALPPTNPSPTTPRQAGGSGGAFQP